MLRKPPSTVYLPGTPEIPYRPEQTVCPDPPPSGPSAPTGGYWMTKCTTISTLVGWDYGPPRSDEPGPFPTPLYSHALVCRSEWVPPTP